ncbi:MAG: thioredoxin fold domain-containing protein [Deltaproteobacteria bacterium]|nr:thioredoxin fold domain-containing protein [Deltaproteobacteria bacterium]
MERINWFKNMNEATEDIKGGSKLLMMFFYSPSCDGSMKTINETLENEDVASLIERECAPIKLNIEDKKELAKERNVDWTPTFILADEHGRELERWVGYLPARDFMAQLLLSKGLSDFHLERHTDAIAEFEEIVEEFTDTDLVPEAEYFIGAANFKLTGQNDTLIDVCHILTSRYPESQWTKKCSVWAHLTHSAPFVGYDGGGSIGGGAY